MDDLVAFLKARLDEDERAIEGTWTPPSMTPSYQLATMQGSIVMMRPERVQREVNAKRRTLEFYEEAAAEAVEADGYEDPERGQDAAVLGDVLRDMAAVYADHPDYRPEWSPTA